jgi:hypothetical protein
MIIDADPETGGAIAKLATTDLTAVITTPGAMDALLDRIERDARAIRAGLDISTERGRKAIGSLAKSKVANAKVQIIDAANKLTEGWRTQTAAVVADRKKVEARLDALRDEIEAEVIAYRAAKAATEKANVDALAALEALVVGLSDLTSAQIEERFKQAGIVAEFAWAVEFVAHAERVQNGAIAQLEVAHGKAKAREAEAAAEEVRQAEEAERQRLAAIEAQKAREAAIAAEATRLAEAEAARLRQQAEEAAQARLLAEAEKARRAEEMAERLLQQAETARIEAHRAALVTMQRLAAPLAHPDWVPVIDAKIRQLKDVFANRDWQEFAEAAGVICRASGSVLALARDQAIALAEKAELDRKEAQRVRDEAAQTMAEARARQELAEKQAAEDAAAAKRSANRTHQAKINGEVLEDIVRALAHTGIDYAGGPDIGTQIAKAIITAVAKGEVRHTKIGY